MTAQYKTNQYTGLPDRVNDTELAHIDSIQFDTNHVATPVEGLLSWNSTDGTLDLGLIGSSVNLQIGQETVVRVKNDEGAIINNGDVVYLSGAAGDNPLVKLADADTVVANAVLGLATEQIAINGHGYITTFGRVRDLNTNSFNAGDVLYLSQTAGQLTTTPPASPAKVVKMGTVLRKNINNGVVLVSVHVETDLSGYVPYTGATGNVDLGANTMTAFSFNCSATSVLDGIESLTITVLDDPYSASWDGSTEVPTKNAIYDKIESLGPGGSFSMAEAEIDFGTTPQWSKTFTVTDALVSGTSKVSAWASGNTATGRVGNDDEWDMVMYSAKAGTGEFTLTAMALPGPIVGKRKIFYAIG